MGRDNMVCNGEIARMPVNARHRIPLIICLFILTCIAAGCVRAKPPRSPAPVAVLLDPSTSVAGTPTAEAAATPAVTVDPETSATVTGPLDGESVTDPSDEMPTLEPGEIIHTVASDDTIYSIAERYYSTVSAILRRNNLTDAEAISVGQMLIVPVGAAADPEHPPAVPADPAEPTPIGDDSAVSPTSVPAPAAPTPAPAQPALIQHTVRRGETLYSLSRLYRTTVADIRALNPGLVDPNHLPAGTVITIRPDTVRTHVVRRGETIASIARQYGVSMQVLVQANALSNPNHVYVGQVLIIP